MDKDTNTASDALEDRRQTLEGIEREAERIREALASYAATGDRAAATFSAKVKEAADSLAADIAKAAHGEGPPKR